MILAGIEDEDKWLAEGIAGIQHNAFYMHRALVIDETLQFHVISDPKPQFCSQFPNLRTPTISETLSNAQL